MLANAPAGAVAPAEQAVHGSVELRNVAFAYPSRLDAPVFTDFSLKVAPGQTMALVGESGSGKSTVVSLLERYYDPQGGQARAVLDYFILRPCVHHLVMSTALDSLSMRTVRSQRS